MIARFDLQSIGRDFELGRVGKQAADNEQSQCERINSFSEFEQQLLRRSCGNLAQSDFT